MAGIYRMNEWNDVIFQVKPKCSVTSSVFAFVKITTENFRIMEKSETL